MPSLLNRVVELLQGRGPLEIFTLAAAAGHEPKPVKKDELWPLVYKILESVKLGEHSLHIVEYPTYRLKGPLPKTLPGRRYVRAAVEALAGSPDPLALTN